MTNIDSTLQQLTESIVRARLGRAAQLVAELRDHCETREALWATVECALIELGGSDALADLTRCVARIRSGFDDDGHL